MDTALPQKLPLILDRIILTLMKNAAKYSSFRDYPFSIIKVISPASKLFSMKSTCCPFDIFQMHGLQK